MFIPLYITNVINTVSSAQQFSIHCIIGIEINIIHNCQRSTLWDLCTLPVRDFTLDYYRYRESSPTFTVGSVSFVCEVDYVAIFSAFRSTSDVTCRDRSVVGGRTTTDVSPCTRPTRSAWRRRQGAPCPR